jgi:hypothetical protein
VSRIGNESGCQTTAVGGMDMRAQALLFRPFSCCELSIELNALTE